MLRVGVAALTAPIERANDWIWMADHSNQIGQEKALVVLGIRASQLPPPGTPLSPFLGAHSMMRLLTVEAGALIADSASSTDNPVRVAAGTDRIVRSTSCAANSVIKVRGPVLVAAIGQIDAESL